MKTLSKREYFEGSKKVYEEEKELKWEGRSVNEGLQHSCLYALDIEGVVYRSWITRFHMDLVLGF